MDWEKRSSPRVRVALQVEYEAGAQRGLAVSFDLGVAGLSLEVSGLPPEEGMPVRVVFALPGSGAVVEAVGVVMWSRPDGPPPRLGLRLDRFLSGYVELGDYLVMHRG